MPKKKNKAHEHIVKTVNVERKLYDLFTEEYPFINFSLFIELCMKEALKIKGKEYKLIEDEIIEGRIKATAKKFEKILQHMGIINSIDIDKNINEAHKNAELLKEAQYEGSN